MRSGVILLACLMCIPHMANAAADRETTIYPPSTRLRYESPLRSTARISRRVLRRRTSSRRPSRRSIIALGDPGSSLGSLRFGSKHPMRIRSLSIMIQAVAARGTVFDPVDDRVTAMISGVRLTNERTGRTSAGKALQSDSDEQTNADQAYQIYRFNDLVVTGNERLHLTMRTKKRGPTAHPRAGDRFRMIACTETERGCLFNGVLSRRFDRHRLEAETLLQRR